jgi:signal transduction histidine kinase
MSSWLNSESTGLNRRPQPGIERQIVIERSARAQAQMIEDLLDMSRIISGKVRLDVQRLDLASIVKSAVETARPAADAKGIRLQTVIDPLDGIVVSGDVNRLQQVLWNLHLCSCGPSPHQGDRSRAQAHGLEIPMGFLLWQRFQL